MPSRAPFRRDLSTCPFRIRVLIAIHALGHPTREALVDAVEALKEGPGPAEGHGGASRQIGKHLDRSSLVFVVGGRYFLTLDGLALVEECYTVDEWCGISEEIRRLLVESRQRRAG